MTVLLSLLWTFSPVILLVNFLATMYEVMPKGEIACTYNLLDQSCHTTTKGPKRHSSLVTLESLSTIPFYIQSMSLNDMPNESSQAQAEDDNSFVCPLPRCTIDWLSMQANCIEILTSCATAHYVNGIVETDTREPISFRSFCHGTAECMLMVINTKRTVKHMFVQWWQEIISINEVTEDSDLNFLPHLLLILLGSYTSTEDRNTHSEISTILRRPSDGMMRRLYSWF